MSHYFRLKRKKKKKVKEAQSRRTAETSSLAGCTVAAWQTLRPAGRQIKKASWRLTMVGASHPTPLEPQHFAPKTPLLPGAPKCPLSLAKWKIMDPNQPPSPYLLVCMSQTLWLRRPEGPRVNTHTLTHTHQYARDLPGTRLSIYIAVCVSMCVCVCFKDINQQFFFAPSLQRLHFKRSEGRLRLGCRQIWFFSVDCPHYV